MITAASFFKYCLKYNYSFFSGTPCSYLSPIINYAFFSVDIDFYPSTNEGDAIGIASGAVMSGRKSVVMFQNSGLGNAVNPLTSLTHLYKIPMLLIISIRGNIDEINDAPQHEFMGDITTELLTCLGIKWSYIPNNESEFRDRLDEIDTYCSYTNQPYALIVKKGIVSPCDDKNKYDTFCSSYSPSSRVVNMMNKNISGLPSRADAIRMVIKNRAQEDLIVATTGMISRELYNISDDPANFYMLGSMGCSSSIALGIGLCTKKRTFVLDGDGALLMRMGNLASVGIYSPANLIHILLDNGANDTTGGQPTFSHSIDFCSIASACSYRIVVDLNRLDDLDERLNHVRSEIGPVFIRVSVKKGAMKNSLRPKLTPVEIKDRFMSKVMN